MEVCRPKSTQVDQTHRTLTVDCIIRRNNVAARMHYELYVRAVLYYEIASITSLDVQLFKRHGRSMHVWSEKADHSIAQK